MNTALALELTKARGYGPRDDVNYFIYKSFDPGPDLAALGRAHCLQRQGCTVRIQCSLDARRARELRMS